ncbi:PAS domain-containing sensor histidine kinase [Veronia nyctiphanis]|uniref:C4-dicarboxylate transport sensor protein DctB n=1 Tax=Veronia nyctiphanis TaxID=1278244 RepID=A0A4Q0YTB1_9GAMM|nr:ATP-binding protein [Veronia nyctiphanis]RXJ74502.1 PAS domain-containing sensor histidine kinase [Veronia nyctiphanis]
MKSAHVKSIKRTLRQKLLMLVCVSLLSISIVSAMTWVVRDVVTTHLLTNAHEEGENRLLSYVSDIRRVLSDYRVLPYLASSKPEVKLLLSGDETFQAQSDAFLADMDKAAVTSGWYILNASGRTVSSSRSDITPLNIGIRLQEKLADSGGEVVMTTDLSSSPVFHYFAAPVYNQTGFAGISLARLELTKLEESWSAADEHVSVSDGQGNFFIDVRGDFPKQNVVTSAKQLGEGFSVDIVVSGDGFRYLQQSVYLDDVGWQVFFLTPLKSIEAYAFGASMITLTLSIALIALMLFLVERKRRLNAREVLQQTVAESEQQLARIISRTNVGLVILDRSGETLFVNPMAKRYFNLSDSMASGMPLWQLFPDSEHNEAVNIVLKRLREDIEGVELTGVEVIAERTDGSRFPLMFSITSFPQGGEQAYLVTLLDISKRKKAEQALHELNIELEKRVTRRTAELESAKEALIEQQKLAAMGRMSSAIVHELNQPLTGLKTLLSSSSLLIERQQLDTLRTNMSLVDTLIDRMASMTSQLKTFAFNRPSELTPLSLNTIVERLLMLNQHRLQSVNVSTVLDKSLPLVLGEPQRVEQAVGNLLTNALDAVHGTDSPTITIAAKVRASDIDEDEQIILEIKDNGEGVSEPDIQRVFEPFYTSKKMGEGLGLGLAITANSMRDIGGAASALVNNDRGMTFTLAFQVFKNPVGERQ